MKRDDLFQDAFKGGAFRFDEQVAAVFDDMLDRSVPGYRLVIDMIGGLLARTLKPEARVLDLGCSTGTTLIALADRLKDLKPVMTGVDNSAAMVARARAKGKAYSKPDIRFIEGDVLQVDVEPQDAVLLQYTLQFVPPAARQVLLERVRSLLKPGGMLVLSEKVRLGDEKLNDTFIDLYYEYKRSQGYSELEISRKREALEHVLVPLTTAQNEQLLSDAGFELVEGVFQWFNFRTWAAGGPFSP